MTCPRCRGGLSAPGPMRSAWTCAEHGTVAPLHGARPGTTEQIVDVAERSHVPVWLPWPLPQGWLVTGVRCAGDDRSGPIGTVVAVSGPNPLRGTEIRRDTAADILLVAEQPAVGLGASLAGLAGVDAGETLTGSLVTGGSHAKIHAAGWPTPLWHVPAGPDRAAYVGEAHGVWLWLIMWPPNAGAMVLEGLRLIDARDPGHPLDLPTGALSPRLG